MADTHSTTTQIAVADVVWREDLYPRIETSATTVQKYAEDLSVLPPIEVNQHNELIDGWHRLTAHKKNKAETISVVVTQTTSDAHLLELAIERNASFGMQLTTADKRKLAVKIYLSVSDRSDRMATKTRLSRVLSVSAEVLEGWLSRSEKELKDQAKEETLNLWLSCHTQDAIAETVGWPQRTVARWLSGFSQNPASSEMAETPESDAAAEDGEKTRETPIKLSKEQLASADHATDFHTPLYNVWKQQTKTAGSEHFGNSEVRWLDNLLYLYTQPFDVVIDPFAGGGSTIDLCRKRLRRYFVSDRAPIVEREKDIRQHDIADGLLKPPQWDAVKLVYLDPPYWKQAEGKYSDDPADLANMDLDTFTARLAGVIKAYAAKVSGHIALIIQPTQWNAPDHAFTDHIGDMLRLVKLPVEMRYSVPYETQQHNAQMVDWAKANKQCLVLTREIVVWRSA